MRRLALAILVISCSQEKISNPKPRPTVAPPQTVESSPVPQVFVDPDVSPVPSAVPSPKPLSSPKSCELSLDLVPTLLVGQEATLRGSACGAHVEVTVDEWPLGTAEVSGGRWSLAYTFAASGLARVLVVNEFAADWTFLRAIERSIRVDMEVDLRAKDGLEHTASVSLFPDAFDVANGLKLYEKGILPQAESKALFLAAVARGVVPRHGNAQCAVTTSSVLESAFKLAGFDKQANYFNKKQRDSFEDPLSCTDRVETMLAKLGWNYFIKSRFVAPKGAIALAEGRWEFCGVTQHSGHIYTILEDRDDKDFIADNSGYGREYSSKTEGFWLPNGVFPKERK